eukprot:2836546-Amphidinium_carterae.2
MVVSAGTAIMLVPWSTLPTRIELSPSCALPSQTSQHTTQNNTSIPKKDHVCNSCSSAVLKCHHSLLEPGTTNHHRGGIDNDSNKAIPPECCHASPSSQRWSSELA